MKRINLNTNRPFKRGDIREDGYVFRQYDLTYILENGFFAESWTRPQNLINNRKQINQLTKDRYKKFSHA